MKSNTQSVLGVPPHAVHHQDPMNPQSEIRIPQSFGLLPYQAAFAANPSRFKIGLWARQTGKDYTATFEAVADSIRNPGTLWMIVAAGERQALESLAKAKEWAETFRLQIADYSEEKASPSARLKSAEIHWANGSRLLALPANPPTIRGYSANLILTEFAFHEDPDAIWSAIYPSISNPLRGGLKKLRIISTPNGLTNKFADLWLNAPGSAVVPTAGCTAVSAAPFGVPPHTPLLSRSRADETLIDSALGAPPHAVLTSAPPHALKTGTPPSARYFKSRLTIHDAIQHGLPLDAAELRAGLNDEDAWSQEYLCEFMDTSSVMFPYDLLAPCESEQATETASGSLPSGSSQLYAGIDFGRKHHLTVCWILERLSMPVPTFVTREVLCLKNTSTPDQLALLRPRLQRCRKICLDYTGAGVGFGDYLSQEFGGANSSGGATLPRSQSRIELCSFTHALKSELFPRLRAAFEQRSLRIPISREIREDLHGIQRTVTHSGQIFYRALHSADGHSDRTTALALAWRAATTAPVSGGATTIFVPGRSADLRWAQHRPRASRSRFRL